MIPLTREAQPLRWHARFVAGANVGIGRDWTLFALIDGQVRFDKQSRRVNIDPVAAPASKS